MASDGMRMSVHLVRCEYRRDAGVDACEDLDPLVSASADESGFEAPGLFRPAIRVEVVGYRVEVGQPERPPQRGEEGSLEGAHRDVPAVGTVIIDWTPSTMATSRCWPNPERLLSTSAARIAIAARNEPPAKSASRFSGGRGGLPEGPTAPSSPACAR
jgi:hypothetical protein